MASQETAVGSVLLWHLILAIIAGHTSKYIFAHNFAEVELDSTSAALRAILRVAICRDG